MRMLTHFAVIFLMSSFTGATPVFGKQAPETTWNKPDISYEQYRSDATECAATSKYVAVYIKPETLARLNAASMATLVTLAESFGFAGSAGASGALTGMEAFHSEDDIARRSYNTGAMFVDTARRDVRDELQFVLDKCLKEKGYTQYRLTDEQRRRLHGLQPHSIERDLYLYSLGGR